VTALSHAKLLDLHCHTAGTGAGGSGCFVSRELEQSHKFGIYLKAFGVRREQPMATTIVPKRIRRSTFRETARRPTATQPDAGD
jgi:hypothetical protein